LLNVVIISLWISTWMHDKMSSDLGTWSLVRFLRA
jgi:hypothetical protein